MTTYNLADIFESVADVLPDREALVCGDDRLSYAELDARATQLAHAFAEAGIKPDDHVGTYLYNCVEYIETMLALFKIRAVPINVNYRYVEEELRYLFNDADLVGVVFHREFAPRIAAIAGDAPQLRLQIVVDDDSDENEGDAIEFEQFLDKGSTDRDFPARDDGDILIIYTGGTTGMPKGVMWRHEDVLFALLQGGNPVTGPVSRPEEVAEMAAASDFQMISLPAAPLIHGAAQAGVLIGLNAGWKSILQPRFDPSQIPEIVAAEGVTTMTIVGDAMGVPIIEAIEANLALGDDAHDVSSLFTVASAGALWTEGCKQRFRKALPNCLLIDAYGSTETGNPGRGDGSGEAKSFGDGLLFEVPDDTVVLDDGMEFVEPGSGERGVVARRGHIPLGYYGDEEKTAKTFAEVDGTRYVLSGDIASVEPDGKLRLYGRESVCINTGGEKVFVEEVENAVKSHEAVLDSVVVGVEDERWGQRVVALVSLATGYEDRGIDVDSLKEHCRTRVAGYKVPKEIYVVDEVFRGPNGKADYKLSKAKATELSNA